MESGLADCCSAVGGTQGGMATATTMIRVKTGSQKGVSKPGSTDRQGCAVDAAASRAVAARYVAGGQGQRTATRRRVSREM
jgi:hypothetical protein